MDNQKLRRKGLKRCHNCKEVKAETYFSQRKGKRLSRYCTACDEILGVVRAEQRNAASNAYYSLNREQVREAAVWQRLRIRYGVTRKWFENTLEEQGGVCKICGKTNDSGKRLHVDHNHETGKVRGLLCFRCNHRLGVLENREWVEAALAYLAEHEELNG